LNLRPAKLTHWVLLAGLLLIVSVAVLLWSTRGLGYPNPADLRRPVGQLGANAVREHELSLTRLLLLCLDSLSRGQMTKAIASCDTALALDPNNTPERPSKP
jgi:hypothetical protein